MHIVLMTMVNGLIMNKLERVTFQANYISSLSSIVYNEQVRRHKLRGLLYRINDICLSSTLSSESEALKIEVLEMIDALIYLDSDRYAIFAPRLKYMVDDFVSSIN